MYQGTPRRDPQLPPVQQAGTPRRHNLGPHMHPPSARHLSSTGGGAGGPAAAASSPFWTRRFVLTKGSHFDVQFLRGVEPAADR